MKIPERYLNSTIKLKSGDISIKLTAWFCGSAVCCEYFAKAKAKRKLRNFPGNQTQYEYLCRDTYHVYIQYVSSFHIPASLSPIHQLLVKMAKKCIAPQLLQIRDTPRKNLGLRGTVSVVVVRILPGPKVQNTIFCHSVFTCSNDILVRYLSIALFLLKYIYFYIPYEQNH